MTTRTLSGQTPGSPIFVRRNMTMPHGLAPAATGQHSVSLSPNHHFLQQHLPPTFPFAAAGSLSPETTLSEPPNHHSMVILTPTTQEWRELKGMESGRIDADDLPSSDSSSSEDDADSGQVHRTVSMGSEDMPSSSSSIRADRPALYQTKSIDFLEKEARHTPDPGSTAQTPHVEEPPPAQPVFTSNIIAPSPSGPKVDDGAEIISFKPRAKRRSFLEPEEDVPALDPDEGGDSSPTVDESPARFASIGRRDSLRITRKPGPEDAPKPKSKRELEREKLFKMVDEELEDVDGDRSHAYTVQEIGRGGLGTTPTREENRDLESQSSPEKIQQTPRSPVSPVSSVRTSPTSRIAPPPRNASVSPTQPMKPSPLHASPMTAVNGLPPATTPSPVGTPAQEDGPQPSRPVLPAPESTDEKIDIMRNYAKALSSHHSQSLPRVPSQSSVPDVNPSSPTRSSPRSPRVRDTTRQSLVAGRMVQPYQPTPSAAQPERPSMFRQASSLQSFSPFRSPQLGPSKGTPGGLMPHLSRLDSTVSIAPSTGVPSECGTPNSETAGGMGGHGIQDYVIIAEAGKGAYGLVMRAKVKGPKGEAIGVSLAVISPRGHGC